MATRRPSLRVVIHGTSAWPERPASVPAMRRGEAFAALGTDGRRREAKRLGVNDLSALADVARLSGNPAEAVAPLKRILLEFAGDAHAPLAAFVLSRLELDSLGRSQAAVRALEQALALGIPRGLREAEGHVRAGTPAYPETHSGWAWGQVGTLGDDRTCRGAMRRREIGASSSLRRTLGALLQL